MKTNILAMLAILPVFAFNEATADSETVGGYTWSFTVSGNSATVTGVSPASGDVAIPSTLGGKSVTSIENYSFEDCSGLTSITIPDGVTSIGKYVFSGCSGLTSVTIPDSVTSIGFCAFCGCSGLTSITIPDGVTSIGDFAFQCCSGLTSITIGSGVTCIGNYAFQSCSGLTSIAIPDGVTSIGNSVFESCVLLRLITIPDGVTSIGDSAFSGCSGLTSITIPNGVTNIGDSAFLNCSGLTSVTIPDSVTSIGSRAFLGCSGLTSITIPNGVSSIEYCAFFGCSGLTSIKIPDSVTSIGERVFYGCSELYDTTSIPGVRLVDGWAVGSEDSLSGFLDLSGVRGIGFRAFYERSGITSVEIPNGLVGIGVEAFEGCSGLTSITIPDSVSCIEEQAFTGCSGLTSITIGSGGTSIGYSAFNGCTLLRLITISDNWPSIGGRAFRECPLDEVRINISDMARWTTNSIDRSLEGERIIVVGSHSTWIPVIPQRRLIVAGEEITNLVIPDGVTSIANSAFYKCSRLTSVTIPDSVTNIGDSTFSDCSGLTSITIGSGVTSIGGSAFYKCSRLTSVTIPDGVTSIGWRAFSGCSGLTSITIPASVTSIGDEAFSGCSGLTSITIQDGVTSIGSHAFSGCSGLTSITIPASVTSIGSSAFSGCSGLTSVTISDSVTSIGSYAFSGCSGLTSVTIPDGVTSIGDYAFSGCSGLTSVTIPDSVTNIGDHVISGCSGLTSISVMQSNASYDSRGDCNAIIRSADNTLIAGCRNTVVPDSVTRIGYAAFSSCSGLTSITIPDSVTSIGSYAFSGCSELTSVTIPASVTSIGYGAFEDCIGLKTLYLPDSYPETPTVPSGCTIVRFGEAVEMSVLSPVGYPIPGVGSGIAPSNIVVACSAPSPVEECGWRYVCMGWRGTGSVPANGTSNAVDVLMLEDSSISWLWETSVWIECTVSGDASLSVPGSGWFPKDGAAAVFSFAPAARPFVHSILGDTDGVSVDAAAGTVTIPSDRPRKVVLHVPTCREAVGTDGKAVEWAQGDGNPWFVVEDATSADGLCLRSGAVAENPGTNALETTVTGPGRLSFSWKMTNTRNDYARFYVDGAQQAQISRTTTAWALAELELDAGPHTLRWAFERGGSSADGAAFLDDVRWIPRHVLTVSSADGTPVPAVGSHDVDWGTEIAASVAAPAASGGTRKVCTGWTGTGSIPASGTGTDVAFTVEEDSTLAWNWRAEHWIDVAVAGGGSTSFLPQWVEDGMTVSVAFSPNWTLYDVALSGDTEGVTISGSTLVIPADGPRTIRVTITERKVSLTVATSAGTVTPAPGVHAHSWGDSIAASAVAPPPETAGVQIVCTGWTGTGSVPASGTRSNVSFTITRDSSIEWKWVTNVWIDVAVTGDGSTDFAPKWVRKGSTEMIQLVPSPHLFTVALSGDVADGVTLDGTTLSVTADKPRHIVVTITERKLSLSVSSAFGTVTPSVGAHSHSWGDPVTASATVPTTIDGTRHVLLGWTGTGSVPASGSGSSVSFTMEESSSIAWRWRTERRISLETAGPVATDFSAGWIEDGTTLAVSYDVLFGDGCAVSLSGDTNGVVHDANARTLSIPCDRVRALRLVAQPPPALTLAEALDSPGLVWTSGGDNAWVPQTSVTADGEDAVASGDASGGDSVLSTVLTGPGTLSWSWRLETTGGAGIDLEVDDTGNPRRYIESDQADSWMQESFDIAGPGTHDVRFVFWNEAGSAADRGFLDGVSWTGAVAGGNETGTTPEPVPHAWLVAHGLAPAGASAAAYESAALAPARNGRPVWECYVAGLDPTKDEDFLARIEMEDGEPRILWTPSNVAGRAYAVYGKALLTNEWSSPVNASHRFFQVRVALGGASGVDESAWPGSVTVSFDPVGGTPAPAARTYVEPGTLGELPAVEKSDHLFTGWWTRAEGGIKATPDTSIPWEDWTLFARWISNHQTVHFVANGGTGEMPDQSFVFGEEQTLAANAFSRTGYAFAGWATNATGAKVYNDKQAVKNITTDSTITLYAVWEQLTDQNAPYMVIDLSGGANAGSYPISYLSAVPSGGWTDTYKTTKLVLKRCEAGTFTMGSPTSESGRSAKETQHTVTLTKAFYIGVFEVTQKQFQLMTGRTPSLYQGDKRPVEKVSYLELRGNQNWPDNANVTSDSVIGRLRSKSGYGGLDLPTEAQWEYACRAGTTTPIANGTSDADGLAILGRFSGNKSDTKGGYNKHTTVGSYAPNAWGLYDMHGNVFEWCLDYWNDEAYGAMPVTDPKGATTCVNSGKVPRIRRGGYYNSPYGECRSARRGYGSTANNYLETTYLTGFRLCITLE